GERQACRRYLSRAVDARGGRCACGSHDHFVAEPQDGRDQRRGELGGLSGAGGRPADHEPEAGGSAAVQRTDREGFREPDRPAPGGSDERAELPGERPSTRPISHLTPVFGVRHRFWGQTPFLGVRHRNAVAQPGIAVPDPKCWGSRTLWEKYLSELAQRARLWALKPGPPIP